MADWRQVMLEKVRAEYLLGTYRVDVSRWRKAAKPPVPNVRRNRRTPPFCAL